MIRFALTAALVVPLAGAATAQDSPWQMPRAEEPPAGEARPYELPDSEPGLLDNFFNDLLSRAQPHLQGLARDMSGLMQDYRPVFEEMSKLIDDLGNYELPPERLPNGDIIIRRKPGAPPPPQPENVPDLAPRINPVPPGAGIEL
ncbi:hypothetical protein [Paracoccus sp. MC1862]|uniref:hypothetical protein n=1 Tax=Paracoccus sp. MC1862 TaxID=2760307 RepID=UPI0016001BB0|nr:hypothetical protein [Paracoccus sp. MC1862]MBB1496881.1 hypothetical protein [Paracoccus sp. MC1862]QQO45505.1 hypothetical protein JGR78_03910 [Paracoccus sp. MC1862]